jgi:hypothetical protein
MRESFIEARDLRVRALRLIGRSSEADEVAKFPVPDFRWKDL